MLPVIQIGLTAAEIARIIGALNGHAARSEPLATFAAAAKAERLLIEALEARAIAARLAQIAERSDGGRGP
jgi:hypothetical protein